VYCVESPAVTVSKVVTLKSSIVKASLQTSGEKAQIMTLKSHSDLPESFHTKLYSMNTGD